MSDTLIFVAAQTYNQVLDLTLTLKIANVGVIIPNGGDFRRLHYEF